MDKLKFNLVYCTWNKVPEELKQFFSSLYGGDINSARRMYENYFMRYNLIHEMTHTLQSKYNMVGNPYENEQGANDVAIAYWSERDPSVIEEVSEIVEHMLGLLKSPVPQGKDEKEYFIENYEKLGVDPAAYGYYQFKLVKNSLEKEFSLHRALKESITIEAYEPDTKESQKETFSIGDVDGIIDGFSKYIARYGVKTPYVITFNQFSPGLQFVTMEIQK